MDGTAITLKVAGQDGTSTIVQKADGVTVKCKNFTVDAETITCKSSKDTVHKSQQKMNVESTQDMTLTSSAGLTAKASSDVSVSGANATVKADSAAKLSGLTASVSGTQKAEMSGAQLSLSGSAQAELSGATVKVAGTATANLEGQVTTVKGSVTNIQGTLVNLG
jgi:hypothetical protein